MNDARLDIPTFHRNHRAIIDVMEPYLTQSSGHALEIGSGTGQHAVAFAQAFPNLTWWPTDPDLRHRDSIDAWREHSVAENLKPASALDAASPTWPLDAVGLPDPARIAVMIAINVLHITPWRVSQGLFAGAGRHLAPGGHLFLYGPFLRDGRHSAESNRQFDMSLRAQNPDWGVRDIADLSALADDHGLALVEDAPMPRDNSVLVFSAPA